jgi:hypothetical protein
MRELSNFTDVGFEDINGAVITTRTFVKLPPVRVRMQQRDIASRAPPPTGSSS